MQVYKGRQHGMHDVAVKKLVRRCCNLVRDDHATLLRCYRTTASPCWLSSTSAVLLLPLQRQATDSKQWFSHLQHEIDILSTVSRNRNVVQASSSPGRFHVTASALPACRAM